MMQRVKRQASLAGFLSAALLAGSGAAAAQTAPAPDMIAKGEYLVRAGDCMACHTATPDKPFAGGAPVNTPFGVIYSPNITPDRETGIGSWSDDDFYRAMHDGIGKGGENLYPVFPFPWYTKVTRDDVLAIKAYIFSQKPIHAPDKPAQFGFPFNQRIALDGWRLLFFHAGTFQPDPKASAAVNRGAYLVQGLGHCAECHTQLNPLGAPEESRALAGGNVDGWYAPNISSDVRKGIGGWSTTELVSFFKNGAAEGHGVVLGPMAQVVHDSLSHLTDADLTDIAEYLKSTPPKEVATADAGAPVTAGAAAYLSNCASCHQVDGRGIAGQIPALAGNGAVTAGGPENVIRAVLGGLRAKDSYGPMPSIGADLTDQQVADITNYVRTAWGNTAPGDAGPGLVGQLRAKTQALYEAAPGKCPTPPGSKLARAIQQPASGVTGLLTGLSDADLTAQVGRIAARVQQIDPGAPRADAVNDTTDAYCPILAANTALPPEQKRWLLERFSELLYGDLLTGNNAPGHAQN
jgi:mono/diheme cytochrome c family protein